MRRKTNPPLEPTVRNTPNTLWRQRFAREAMRQISELRQDPEAWQEYLAEADESYLADGIGEETRMGD